MSARRVEGPRVQLTGPRGINPVEATARAIEEAERSVAAVVYKFDKRRVYKALRRARRKGVKVRLLVDEWQVTGDVVSYVPESVAEGAEVRCWEPGKLHAKFTIVDRSLVITGSFNWTKSAAKNNTELMMCFEDPGTVAAFERRFREMWGQATQVY